MVGGSSFRLPPSLPQVVTYPGTPWSHATRLSCHVTQYWGFCVVFDVRIKTLNNDSGIFYQFSILVILYLCMLLLYYFFNCFMLSIGFIFMLTSEQIISQSIYCTFHFCSHRMETWRSGECNIAETIYHTFRFLILLLHHYSSTLTPLIFILSQLFHHSYTTLSPYIIPLVLFLHTFSILLMLWHPYITTLSLLFHHSLITLSPFILHPHLIGSLLQSCSCCPSS